MLRRKSTFSSTRVTDGGPSVKRVPFDAFIFKFIHHINNMVAQANKTSKNTTNEIEKMTTVPLYTYKLLNSIASKYCEQLLNKNVAAKKDT